jgi:hypothetical protein
VLIGTSDYAFLRPVPAAGHSLRRMAALLSGPLCGWPRERLIVHPNVPSPGDLLDQLITAFEAVTDVALFYFVGHGQISPDDQLCLGLARSRPEASRRAVTSLRFGDVRQALLDSKAAVKIVILDCCFAGLATVPSLAGDVLDLTAGTGAYTMAATSAYTTAWYQDEAGLAEPQTYFTKYLADLVEEGIPGLPSRLQVDPLYRKLLVNLVADGRPAPRSRAVDDAREFEFAYNAAPAETHRDPELELLWLTQRFDDEVARRAEAEARLQTLQAEAHERRLELERLQARTRHMEQLAASQQRQLLEAIGEGGILVFSIFQGGTLTGSFHLPAQEIQRLGVRLASGQDSVEMQANRPRVGEAFLDVRGASRTMRLSWYANTGIPVISLWEADTCTGTFRMSAEEVPRLTAAMTGTGQSQPIWDRPQ